MPSTSTVLSDDNADGPRRSGRSRVPSKRVREAMGVYSDDDYDDDDDNDTHGDNTASNTADNPPVSVEDVSETDNEVEDPPASSMASVTTTSATESRLEKFNRRFNVTVNSDEKVLKLQRKAWTSAYYEHFQDPVIHRDGDKVRYVFTCRFHPSIKIARARHDESTSNLKRHVVACTPANNAETQALAAYAHGSTYSPHRLRVNIALWTSESGRPFAIVDDERFGAIIIDFNAKAVIPSRQTVARDMLLIHELTKTKLMEDLKAYNGKIHIGTDGWTSPNVISFLGVTIHFASGSQIVSRLLDFIKVSKKYTGENLASYLAECLQDFGIDKKVMALVADNGSNNDTLVDELAILLPAFRGKALRVRCFGHVLNLTAKSVLSMFARRQGDSLPSALADLTDPDDDDDEDEEMVTANDDEVAAEVASHDSHQVDEVIDEADLDGRAPSLSTQDKTIAQVAITKLRKLALKIHWSPVLREDLKASCEQVGITPRNMVRDVATRWNSTSEAIKRAVELRSALDRLTNKEEHNRPGGVRLRRFRLTPEEWKVLEQLLPMLKIILFATKEVSRSTVPLVHQVIPFIDSITAYFDKVLDNTTLLPAVRHAALRGLLMINKYYGRTDESIVYRIAMILHPRYKTQYFARMKWEPSWIQEAIRLATVEFQTNYKVSNPSSVPPAEEVSSSSCFADARRHFDSIILGEVTTSVDPLEEWLASPPIPGTNDPLVFWDGMKQSGHPLAQMAIDFLSVPAASTDVERAFSKGGLTVSKLRHSLSDKSTRAATVLGAWSKAGLVPFDKAVTAIKDKAKRPKKKARVDSEVVELSD